MFYGILTLPGTADFFQRPMGVVGVADSEEVCDRPLRAMKIEWEECNGRTGLLPQYGYRTQPRAHQFPHRNDERLSREVQCGLNESHLGYGVYGFNGIGEDIGASMAAITSSAICNAISIRILGYPITPDKVLRALEKI